MQGILADKEPSGLEVVRQLCGSDQPHLTVGNGAP